MFTREHVKTIINRCKEERKFIQIVAGPRQVGKTTMVLQALEGLSQQCIYASADSEIGNNPQWINQQWERARLQLRQLSGAGQQSIILVLDEIQKIHKWSDGVKALWDEDSLQGNNIKVILLGSSPLLMQKGLTESLAGRYEMIHVGHWSFTEMKVAFGISLEEYIWYGGFPGPVDMMHDVERWKQYIRDALIEASVSRDILMYHRIDKPAILKALFEMGSLYSGQILAFNKILGQLQGAGNTVTLSHYLTLLDNAGLLAGINKYSRTPVTTRASSPKFQVYNTAFMSALSATTMGETLQDPAQWGRYVESAIGATLVNQARNQGMGLHYWREKNKEVDFVLTLGRQVIALEVKSSTKPGGLEGLSTFKEKYGADKALLVGAGGIPVEEFLTIEVKDLF